MTRTPSRTADARSETSPVVVERIDDVGAFRNLRTEWTALLEASDCTSVFLTWEWLYTWWKHRAPGALCVLTARIGGELVAVAPFTGQPRRIAHLVSVPSVAFMGTDSVGSDYVDIIVRRGAADDAVAALAEHLASAAPMLDLRNVTAEGSVVARLGGQLGRRGWKLVQSVGEPCPFISLRGHTWQSYLATLGPEHRYNFHRRSKQAAQRFGLSFDLAATESERRQALACLVELHHKRWQGRGGSDGLHTQGLVEFHDEFTRLALERGWLRLFVLRLGGQPVAALYGVRYGRTFFFYQSGFDPAYAKYSVGLVTMGLAIKHALEEGAEEYDFLHGDESYKSHWARERRMLARLELYPPDARGRLALWARGASRKTKTIVRRALPGPLARRLEAVRRLGPWKGLYAAWR